MVQISLAYQVLALTEERFALLLRAIRSLQLQEKPGHVVCAAYAAPDDDTGEADGWPIGMMVTDLIYGAFGCTVFRHRAVEAFLRKHLSLTRYEVCVELKLAPEGFRLTVLPMSGLVLPEGLSEVFAFESSGEFYRSWLEPPQDEAFIRASLPKIWGNRERFFHPSPKMRRCRFPLLFTDARFGFEIAPGAWMHLPSHRDPNHPPFLVLDPERYAWLSTASPEHRFTDGIAEGDLVLDVSCAATLESWYSALEASRRQQVSDPLLATTCGALFVDRVTQEPLRAFSVRPFVWTRYVD